MHDMERFRLNSPPVIEETIDNETIIVNLDTGVYYTLNPVGAHVWGSIDRGAPAQEIIDGVVNRFQASLEDARPEVIALINRLVEEQLIVPRSGDEGGPDAPSVQDGNGSLAHVSYEPPRLKKYTDMQELLLLDPVHEVDDAGWPERL